MTVRRGDIVLVAFPFADGTGSKFRPALVVQCDKNNERLKNTIVVMITSRTSRALHEPTQLLIDLNTPEGRESGLLNTSAITCENVFTIEQSCITRMIGALPMAAMARVDECLKASIGIAA